MIINYEPLLDFDDVLIQPQRSRSASRQEVEVEREFRFYHSNKVWEGVPIMAANMDTTGTFEIAEQLYFRRCITCLHKFYSKEEIYNKFLFYLGEMDYPDILDYIWVSVGIKEHDFEKVEFLFKNKLPCNLCIDVANGYTDDFVGACRQFRTLCDKYNTDSVIMAGNVCTPEMVQELVLHGGVDIVKVGIGPGCLLGSALVITEDGPVPIQNVAIGTKVLTSDNSYQTVCGKTERFEYEYLYCIDGLDCTANHEFAHFKDDKFGWIAAENIDRDTKIIQSQHIKSYPQTCKKIEYYSCQKLTNPVIVYDIEVTKNHNFWVSTHKKDILVHNSACSTRLKTGVGFPQLSAVINCSGAAHGLKRENKRLALICSDGGCRIPADVSKAIGGGADFVMLGGMFAGCNESGGKKVLVDGKEKIEFYGMSSKEAQDKHSGGMSDYKASEGRCLYLEPKGTIHSIISDIMGGIRSCCAYIGADSIKDMAKCTKFNVVRRIHNNPNL